VTPFEEEDFNFVKTAESNVLIHMDVVNEVAPGATKKEVNIAFREVKYYWFGGTSPFLFGLSSVDGSCIYISKTKKEIASETIEHEMMHCLPRLRDLRKGIIDYKLISPEKNHRLRIDGELIEASTMVLENRPVHSS